VKTSSPSLDPGLGRAFGQLEGRLRRALAWRGLADLVLLLAAAALCSLALDRLVELSWISRLAILLAVIFLYIRVLLRGRRRTRQGLGALDLLATVESHDQKLQGQLMNAIELTRELDAAKAEGRAGLEIDLLRRAAAEARRAASRAEMRGALDLWPVRSRVLLAGAAVLSLGAVAFLAPAAFGIWARRNVLLSSEPWPRATHFALDRHEPVWHHPRKSPLEIQGWVVGRTPRDVFIQIESSGEKRRSRLVPGIARRSAWVLTSEERAGGPGPDEEADGRRLAYSLPGVTDSFEFHFLGGDNRSRPVRVEAHDRPRILRVVVRVRPPEHSGEEEAAFDDPAGEIAALAGAEIEVTVEADQPLAEAWTRFGGEGRVAAPLLDGGRSFSYTLVLRASGFLEIGVVSAEWGFEGRPARLALVALPDRPPLVRLLLRGPMARAGAGLGLGGGAGGARLVTPQGKIAYGVEALDDYGFSALALRLRRSDAPSIAEDEEDEVEEEDLAPWEAVRVDSGWQVQLDRLLALEPLSLHPGVQFSLQASATDNDAPAGLKKSLSNVELFEVIEPEKLREEMERVRVEVQARLEELVHRESALAEGLELASAEARSSTGERIATEAGSPGAQRQGALQEGSQPRSSQQGSQQQGSQQQGSQQQDSQQQGSQQQGSQQQDSQQQGSQQQGSQQQGSQQQGSQQQGSQQQGSQQQGSQQQGSQQQGSQQQGSQQQGSQQQGSQQQGSQQQGSQQQGSQQQGSQQQGSQQQGSQQQGSQQQGSQQGSQQQQQGSQQQGSQQEGSPQRGSQQQPRREPRPTAAEERFRDLAREQERIAREARRLAQELERMVETLADNQLMDETERRRFDDEVQAPLEELAEERLPRSARDLEAIPRASRPAEAVEEAEEDIRRMERALEGVVERLAQTGDFREILQRLESIIELHGKVIGGTRERLESKASGARDQGTEAKK
jgi:hypothetical protein